MTKYKNTYILKKQSGDTYYKVDVVSSAYSICPPYLDASINVSEGTLGVIKFTDNIASGKIRGFDGYDEIQLVSAASEDINDGISTKNMRTNSCSCVLMHANPKLTGNVKVVVDSKSNLYIDTFKVNDAMSKRKYRHIPISYKDYYGNNLMSVFRDVTSNDFYDVPAKYRGLFTVTHNYIDQYVDVYRYGASTNRDNLYSEALSILAPLKVGKILPDFFVIFRVDGGIDESKTNLDTLKYLLEHGEQIKFYDFREGSHLGTYIRNIYNHSKDFVGYVYDSREDQNTNIINGISIDRGVSTSAHESTSFSVDFEENPSDDVTNRLEDVTQTSINEYYTRGYERNRLVAPDLINFEFMFNDDTEQFSLNTYVGLYLTENDIRSDFYITEINEETNKIKFSDEKQSIDIPKPAIIHAYTSEDEFIRTNAANEYDKLKKLGDKFGNNVLSLPIKYMDEDMNKYKAYVSFTVNDVLKPGEHLRIIMTQNDSTLDATTTIYEVVLSNNNEYLKLKHHISEDSIVYKEFDYDSGLLNNRHFIIHRISISLGESEDDIKDILESYKQSDTEEVSTDELYLRFEMDAIYHAFRSFDDAKFESISLANNTISIGIFDTETAFNGYEFQRITSNIVYNTKNEEKLKDEDDTESKKITYFGDNIVPLMVINPLDRNSILYDSEDESGKFMSYTPFNYEILGPRQTNVVEFINIDNLQLYEVNPVTISDHVLHDQLVIVTDDNEVKNYDPFIFTYRIITEEGKLDYKNVNINVISSMYRSNLMMVRGYDEDVDTTYINLYEPYMLSEAICGIIPIKDYDRNVKHSDKPFDEYDSHYVDLSYLNMDSIVGSVNTDEETRTEDSSVTDPTSIDFDDESGELNVFLTEWYKSGIRNTIGALTTPSIVKWEASATEYNGQDASQSMTKYILTKYRNIDSSDSSTITAQQKYSNIDMSAYIGDMTVRESLLEGKITIEDIVTKDMPKDITVDAVDEHTLRFMIDGLIRDIVIDDTTTINMDDYKNFNIYLAQSTCAGNVKDVEIFIDVINRDILIVWYTLYNKITSYGVDGSIFDEIQTSYTERDIHIENGSLYLGDEQIDGSTSTILYTDNLQISYQDGSILMYNQYGYTYNENDDEPETVKIGYTVNPSNYDLNRICKNNKVTKYKKSGNGSSNRAETQSNEPNNPTKFLCGTFIKESEEGYSNYTNDVVLSISLGDEVITRDYVKTWYSPMLVDWVTFNDVNIFAENSRIIKPDTVFTKTYLMNILPDKVIDTIPMYYNKVSNKNDYSVYKDSNEEKYRVSIGRNYEYKPMKNCFAKNYNVLTDVVNNKDKNTYIGGFTSGGTNKTYLNSIALNTRKNDITDMLITIWNGVSVRDRKIYFNITSSLINKIMSMNGYSKSWSYYKDSRYNDMKRFIINSILPYLTIDNKSELVVYYQKGRSISGSSVKPSKAVKIDNIKKEVIRQNGEYYVVISPDIHRIGTYYITFKVTQ